MAEHAHHEHGGGESSPLVSWLNVVVLLILSAFLAWSFFSGRLRDFIAPRYIWFSPAASVVLLFMAIARVAGLVRGRGEIACACDAQPHEHAGGLDLPTWVYHLVLIAPIVCMLVVAPRRLSPEGIRKRAVSLKPPAPAAQQRQPIAPDPELEAAIAWIMGAQRGARAPAGQRPPFAGQRRGPRAQRSAQPAPQVPEEPQAPAAPADDYAPADDPALQFDLGPEVAGPPPPPPPQEGADQPPPPRPRGGGNPGGVPARPPRKSPLPPNPTVLDVWNLVQSGRAGELDGVFTSLIGQCQTWSAERFMLSRLVVTCCIADAATVTVEVVPPPGASVEDGAWVSVSGVFKLDAQSDPNSVALHAVSMNRIQEPADPYL